MVIAIDFDGTIVENRYPAIGDEMLFAVPTMQQLIKHRHQLILWTFRVGRELDAAVEFCRSRGVEFYAVNCSWPGEKTDEHTSRKIHADLFIDDRNIGGFIGWSKVWQMLNPEGTKREFEDMVFDYHAHTNYKSFSRNALQRIIDDVFSKKR